MNASFHNIQAWRCLWLQNRRVEEKSQHRLRWNVIEKKWGENVLPVEGVIKQTIADQGRTQAWVVDTMNAINPELNMNRVKFNRIVTAGERKLSGNELIALCRILDLSLEDFY